MEKTDINIVKVSKDDIHEIVLRTSGLQYKEKNGVRKPGSYSIIGYQGINFTMDDSHPFVKDLAAGSIRTATVEFFVDEDGKKRADYAGHTSYDSAVKRSESEARVAMAEAKLKALESATLTPETIQSILATSAGF